MKRKSFTMTSHLKRSKFYFLAIAIFSFVAILVSYNWNIRENIYKISRDISHVNIAHIHLADIGVRVREIETTVERGEFELTTANTTKGTVVMKTAQSDKGASDKHKNDQIDTSIEKANNRTTEIGDKVKKKSDNQTAKYNESLHTTLKSNETKSPNGESKDISKTNTNYESKANRTTEADNKTQVNQSKVSNTTSKLNSSVADEDDTVNNMTQTLSQVSSTTVGTSSYNISSKENIKLTKKETQEILDKINKLKEEILSDHKHGFDSKKSESNGKKSGHHKKTDDQGQDTALAMKKDNFVHISNSLRNLGLASNFINPAFWMSENKAVNDKTNNVGSTVTTRPDLCVGCFANSFKKLINEPDICEGETELIMLITSTPSKKKSRDAIRKTWCEKCNKNESKIKYVFVFGNKNNSEENAELLKESKQYHDIIQMDFWDTYANLTYKTISSFQWSQKYCEKAKYVMKTDDDMYVNTDLLPLLLKAAPSKKFIGGMCWGPSSPHRDLNSKWYVSFVQYRHPLFPSMCSGTGYVMSRDTVVGVLRQSPNVPFFHLEDVYVAICVKREGITPVLLDGFKNSLVDFEPCMYRNQLITAHDVSADSLKYIWKERKTCPKANRTPEMIYRAVPV